MKENANRDIGVVFNLGLVAHILFARNEIPFLKSTRFVEFVGTAVVADTEIHRLIVIGALSCVYEYINDEDNLTHRNRSNKIT